MFQITVETRRATVEEKELLTSGSVGIQAQFTFSADWDGLTRTAVFRREDDEDYYGIVLDETNISVIPWEILTDPDVTVYAGAFGENESGEIVIPTVWVTLGAVREGAHSGNSSSADPTPTQWSQILGLAESADQKAGAAQDIAQSVRDDADAGEFDGEPGPAGYTPQKGIDYFDGDTGPVGPAGIAVQSTAPSTDEKVWLDPDEDTSAVVPEIYATTTPDVYNMGDEYLSAESVYDRTQGKTQAEINQAANTVGHTNIAEGIDVYRNGKLCVVLLNGGPDNATFPIGLRPVNNVSAIVRGTSSGTRQTCLITLQTTGAFSTSYFVPNTTTANTFTGTVNGQFVYLI